MRQTRRLRRTILSGLTVLAPLTTAALIASLILLTAQGTRAGASQSLPLCLATGVVTCPPPSPTPGTPRGVPYSHSWYIDDPKDVPALAQGDAQWLNQQSAANGCAGEFLTVLDFGHPTTKYSGNASPLDNYAMSLFSAHPTSWLTYRQVEQLAEQYVNVWHATASSCPRLRLVLGTSNYSECLQAVGKCSVNQAGQQWDVVVHDVMTYVRNKGYDKQVTGVWVGDDLEGSWDPWPTTVQFLEGVRTQELTYSTHARLVDYGDANAGACSEVTGDCATPWTVANVYAAAWKIGWDMPLPETYSSGTTTKWENLKRAESAIQFLGVMTECSGADPLPTGRCWVQNGTGVNAGNCQWSPTIGFTHLQAADPPHKMAYATNMQWAHQQSGSHDCG